MNDTFSVKKVSKSEDPMYKIQHVGGSKTEVPMYCKDKVYSGVEEFSLEELRAIRMEKRKQELESKT